MLKHWSRCSDKELFAKIVYKAITTYHACQDARMKKLVSVATNRLVGNSSLHHVKKAYEVMVRYDSEQSQDHNPVSPIPFQEGELHAAVNREMSRRSDVAMLLALAHMLLQSCLTIDSCTVQVMERLRQLDSAYKNPKKFTFAESNMKDFTRSYEKLISYLSRMMCTLGLMAFLDVRDKINLCNLPR